MLFMRHLVKIWPLRVKTSPVCSFEIMLKPADTGYLCVLFCCLAWLTFLPDLQSQDCNQL